MRRDEDLEIQVTYVQGSPFLPKAMLYSSTFAFASTDSFSSLSCFGPARAIEEYRNAETPYCSARSASIYTNYESLANMTYLSVLPL
jgi:hypothetical protein